MTSQLSQEIRERLNANQRESQQRGILNGAKPSLNDVVNAVLDARASAPDAHTFVHVDRLYVQLGSLQYHLVGPLTGLESQQPYDYSEHTVVEGKTRLQFAGENTDTLILTFQFHAELGDPDLEIAALRATAAAHQALPLVWASGVVRGRYVITLIEETLNQTDDVGRRLSATVRLTLREWIEAVVLETTTPRRAIKKTSAKPAAIAPAPTSGTLTSAQLKSVRDLEQQLGMVPTHDVPTHSITRQP